MTSHRASRLAAAVFVIAAGISFSTHQITAQRPPPEMRALLDAIVRAVNSGSADAWDSFVQARFAPALAQKFTRQQRDQMYQEMVTEFGTIALGGVQRHGPSAPLQMRIKGSNGSGMFLVDVDELELLDVLDLDLSVGG